MNAALLIKWWWRFFADRNHLWGVLINDLYYLRRKPLAEELSFRLYSFQWRSVLATKIFKCGISFSIGDGQKVSFWTDIWCDKASLRTIFSCIFDRITGKNLNAKECWGGNGWRWSKILTGFTPISQFDCVQIVEFKELISEWSLDNR